MPGIRARAVAITGTVLLLVLGCLVGAVLVEATYRAYLVYKHPHRFNPPDHDRYFAAYNVSHWEFDERFGYVYPPGRIMDHVGVADGRVQGCEQISVINEFGNIGPVAGDWKTASLKIAVFGDSWSAFHQGGQTWPHFLQKILTERLKRSVAVMNFGRDGYGVLQMFDLAAAKVVEWKPDIVIIAFITDDLTRGRFWRTVVGEGNAQRVLTTIEPVRVPRDDRAADTYLLMASATFDWCKSMAGTGRVDTTLSNLIEKHRLLRRKLGGPVPSVWELRRSYLFDRLWRRNAFWHVDSQGLRAAQNPRHTYSSYAQDARLTDNLARLRTLNSRLVLFHLAIYPEIRAKKEYLVSRRERALLDSLETVTAQKILRTSDYVTMPVERPERMKVSHGDFHPSLWGMEFYANAVAQALFQEGILERRGR